MLDYSNEHEIKVSVIKVLAEFKERLVLDALIRSLGDERHDVFFEAAKALGKIKSKAAIKPLKNYLFHRKGDFRADAVTALAEIDAEASIETIASCLQDKNPYVNSCAFRALSKIKPELLIPNLLKLSDTRSPKVRQDIFRLLEKTDGRAIEFLIKLLDSSKVITRKFAIQGLVFFGASAESAIIAQLKNENPLVRGSVIQALCLLKLTSSAEVINFTLLHDKNKSVCREAAKALGELGDNNSVNALISILGTNDKILRTNAAQSPAQIAKREKINPFTMEIFTVLLKLALDSDNKISDTAKNALRNNSEILSENLEMIDLLLINELPGIALSNFIKISAPPFFVINTFSEILKHKSIYYSAGIKVAKLGKGNHLDKFLKFALKAAIEELNKNKSDTTNGALNVLKRIATKFPALVKEEISDEELIKFSRMID